MKHFKHSYDYEDPMDGDFLPSDSEDPFGEFLIQNSRSPDSHDNEMTMFRFTRNVSVSLDSTSQSRSRAIADPGFHSARKMTWEEFQEQQSNNKNSSWTSWMQEKFSEIGGAFLPHTPQKHRSQRGISDPTQQIGERSAKKSTKVDRSTYLKLQCATKQINERRGEEIKSFTNHDLSPSLRGQVFEIPPAFYATTGLVSIYE